MPCGPQGFGVTLNAYFSLSKHTKQLLLVTYCDTPAEIEVGFRTHGRTDSGRTDGRTDRRGSRNSYLDVQVRTVQHLFCLKHAMNNCSSFITCFLLQF